MDKVIPVVVIKELEQTEPTLKALKDGGINCAEITFRTACAESAIKLGVQKFPDMNIGAGTVINLAQAKKAVAAGAKFLVSPGLSVDVAKFAKNSKIIQLDPDFAEINKNINVDVILQSIGREGKKDISFTVAQDGLEDAIKVLGENKEALTIKEIKHNANVAKVAIVGAGMMSNPGVASQMFEALFNSGININMISTSEIRITVLIDEKDVDRATRAIHEKFALGEV